MRKISFCFFLAFLRSIIGLSVSCKADPPPAAVTYIYLTIDDGPLGGIRGTLGVIDQIKTPISMMIVGEHVEASEEHKLAFQEAKKNPLVMIGNHSYSHAHDHYELFYENPEKVLEDFNKNQKTLDIDWKIARLPGRNMWQVGTRHKYDIKSGQTSAQLLKKNGYTVFGWDIEWQHNPHTGEPVESVESLLKEVEEVTSKSFTPGHVVILAHDEMFRSAQEDSTLLKLLKALREKGYVFASLDEFPHPRFFVQRLSRMQEKLGSADYLSVEELEKIVVQEDALLTRVLRPLGDHLQAAGYAKQVVLELADRFLGRTQEPFSMSVLQSFSEETRAERMFSQAQQAGFSTLEDPMFALKSQKWKETFQNKLQRDPQGTLRILNHEKNLLLKTQEQKRIHKFVHDYTLKEKHLEDLKYLRPTSEIQNKKRNLEKELHALACSGTKDGSAPCEP